MFIVKIRTQAYERTIPLDDTPPIDSLWDERFVFIPAERVDVHGTPGGSVDLSAWGAGEYVELRSTVTDRTGHGDPGVEHVPESKLICVTWEGELTWYAVSTAWLLGPTGDTIERIAP